MTTREEISAAALSLVGTPFHTQGRLAGVGIDCLGALKLTGQMCNIVLEDRAAYSLRPSGELMPELDRQLVRIQREEEACVLLMSFDSSPPHHVAIMVSGNRIVHAYSTVRKCVVQPYSEQWRSKVRAIYRFPGVE